MRRWSPYGYAFNNPMRFIDNDGLIPFPVNAKYKGTSFRIDSYYGYRATKLSYASTNHKGLDFNFGSDRFDYGAEVLATHEGSVSVKNDLGGEDGRTVTITSLDGTFRTKYLHLKTINVKNGQTVSESFQIGEIGGSRIGLEYGGQVHLHYQIEKYNTETDEWEPYDPTEGKEKTKENVVDPQKWIEQKKDKKNDAGILNIGKNVEARENAQMSNSEKDYKEMLERLKNF